MSSRSGPPEFPSIRLELLEDQSPAAPPGFLRLVRRRLRAHYPDGSVSAPFIYDEVDRRSIDAVVIAAHYTPEEGGDRRVFLRSALRPPIYFRSAPAPVDVPDSGGGLWELPAGLVEPHEQTADGLVSAAARELSEEVGFTMPNAALRALGPSMFPSPGVIAERHFFFEVEVDPKQRAEPSLDGSALEKDGVILDVSVAAGLAMCAKGEIEDGKTELALRRLVERYPC